MNKAKIMSVEEFYSRGADIYTPMFIFMRAASQSIGVPAFPVSYVARAVSAVGLESTVNHHCKRLRKLGYTRPPPKDIQFPKNERSRKKPYHICTYQDAVKYAEWCGQRLIEKERMSREDLSAAIKQFPDALKRQIGLRTEEGYALSGM